MKIFISMRPLRTVFFPSAERKYPRSAQIVQNGGIRSVSHELRLHAAQGTSALHGPFLLHCAKQRRYHLLFAADNTRQHDRTLPAFLAERGMHQILCTPADIE